MAARRVAGPRGAGFGATPARTLAPTGSSRLSRPPAEISPGSSPTTSRVTSWSAAMTNVLWKTMWQYRRAQHARLKGRRGPRKPTIEVGHSILVSAYHMPNRNEALIT